jgi:ribonuclease HI
LPAEEVVNLAALAEDLKLPDFDLLLVGDGSGTVYDRPAGWACAAYDRRKAQAVAHAGGLTCGTNNFAELVPYVQALWFHHQDHEQSPQTPVAVTIVSDSELTVRCGNKQYARHANGSLWAAVDWFQNNGYELSWRHVRRNSNVWNTWADGSAGYFCGLMYKYRGALLGQPIV